MKDREQPPRPSIPKRAPRRGRPRSGTLDYTKTDGYVVVYPAEKDGVTIRLRHPLGTHDARIAPIKQKRFMADLNAGKIAPADAAHEAARVEYLFEACERVHASRKAAGIVSAGDAIGRLRLYAYPELRVGKPDDTAQEDDAPEGCAEAGRIEVTEIRPLHINAILDYARDCGKSRETIKHLKQDLLNVFAALLREEAIIGDNPVETATMPTMAKVIEKERAVLEDAELATYLGYEHPQEHWRMAILETQVMTCMSRMFGGLRTGDLHVIKWESLDTSGDDGRFEWGRAPRAKTKRPQLLAIPEMLKPILRDWWERQGRPTTGLVFPARRGTRVGEQKKKVSHARAFRRDLKRAFGIERWDETKRKYVEARAMTAREIELFSETAETLPVDFHSWRRSYSQALADADVNAQQAQMLAGHSTLAAHGRYLRNAGKLRHMPEGALPQINVRTLEPGPRSGPGEFSSRHLLKSGAALKNLNEFSGADGTRTRGLRRDRAKVRHSGRFTQPDIERLATNDPPCVTVERPELLNSAAKFDPVCQALETAHAAAVTEKDWLRARALATELEARHEALNAANVVPIRRPARRHS